MFINFVLNKLFKFLFIVFGLSWSWVPDGSEIGVLQYGVSSVNVVRGWCPNTSARNKFLVALDLVLLHRDFSLFSGESVNNLLSFSERQT